MTRFTARFWNGESRSLKAVNIYQAHYMAAGIAKVNKWKVKSVACA